MIPEIETNHDVPQIEWITFIRKKKEEETLSTNMYHRPICSLCYVKHASM